MNRKTNRSITDLILFSPFGCGMKQVSKQPFHTLGISAHRPRMARMEWNPSRLPMRFRSWLCCARWRHPPAALDQRCWKPIFNIHIYYTIQKLIDFYCSSSGILFFIIWNWHCDKYRKFRVDESLDSIGTRKKHIKVPSPPWSRARCAIKQW